MTAPDYMREEIFFQVEILQKFIDRFSSSNELKRIDSIVYDEVWFTGSGDSHCASLFGSSLLNQLKIPARAFHPMELSNFHNSNKTNPCLVAISVSGKTPRVIEVVKKFKIRYPEGTVIGLTDNPTSPLYKEVNMPILIGASPAEVLLESNYKDDVAKKYTGYHHDVAQTKSFLANILWILGISLKLSNMEATFLHSVMYHIEEWIKTAENWANMHPILFPQKTMFVGSGLLHSLAQFGQYKWFEFTFPALHQDIEEYAHTHYFATDTKTSLVFFGPFGHLKRIEELILGALQPLIKPEIILITGSEKLNSRISSDITTILKVPSVNDANDIWAEVQYYLYALIYVEWIAYYTAKKAGLNTNTFRGGKDGEKYVRGSFATIRQSQISVNE